MKEITLDLVLMLGATAFSAYHMARGNTLYALAGAGVAGYVLLK